MSISLWQRLQQVAALHPSGVAVQSGQQRLTYQQLVEQSSALAAHIHSRLGDDCSPLLVWGHKEPELVVAYLAALRCGHPYVPLDVTMPAQRLEQVRQITGSRLQLTAEDVRTLTSSAASPPFPAADTPAYIMFTSGSSGEPKGVIVTHGGLLTMLEAVRQVQAFDQDVILNTSVFSFDFAVLDIYLALLCGGTVFCLQRDEIASPRLLFERLADSHATVWHSTPTFARLCLGVSSFGRPTLPAMRRFSLGGEQVTHDVVREIWRRFGEVEVWNLYGPTEATVLATLLHLQPRHLEYDAIPLGEPLPGMRVRTDDGEIVIAGPQISPGYLHHSSSEFFTLDGERAYRTGDRGHVVDGLLFFDGRTDRQIKLQGRRIELGDVEANLRALPGVVDAAVLPCEAGLTAFITVSVQVPVRHWRQQLAKRVPPYMVPKRIQVVTALPMTANGKVDYAVLAQKIVSC